MTSIHDEFYAKLLKTIEDSNNKQTKDITEQIKTEIKSEVEELKKVIKDEVRKRTQLEVKYEDLKLKYENLEKSLRKNNIIIFGLENKTDNLLKYTVDQLNRLLELNLNSKDINDVFTIGNQKEKKPLIVKFLSYITKKEVLKNCKKLKGTGINISEELNLEERKRNKLLRQHLKEARTKGYTVYIKNNKLYVNEKAYSAEELIVNEEDTDTEDAEENPENELPKSSSERNLKRSKSLAEIDDSELMENEGKKKKITIVANKPITRTTALAKNNLKENEKNKAKDTPKKT